VKAPSFYILRKMKVLPWIERKLLSFINPNRRLGIQLDITNLCNLRCTHCYHPHHRNEGALSLDQWFSVLDQYDALRRKLRYRPELILCGGEPLLSPMLLPLLTYAHRLDPDFRFVVLTNGTLATKPKLEQLKQFKNLSFQVSIDGATPEQHDRVRGSGNFERARLGVRNMREDGFPVRLLCTLSKRNASQLSSFFLLARNWGVNGMNFTRMIEQGYARTLVNEGEDRTLQPLELKTAFTEILRQSALTGVETNSSIPLMHLIHPALGANGKFFEGIVVDHQGKLLASSRSRLALGNVLHEGLEQLFLNHPILKSLRKREVTGCGECKHYLVCGGDRNAAYAATGDYLGRDPGCWIVLSRLQSRMLDQGNENKPQEYKNDKTG
jgi:radical SAM protein with 4Fe4S-binding SPASM domain